MENPNQHLGDSNLLVDEILQKLSAASPVRLNTSQRDFPRGKIRASQTLTQVSQPEASRIDFRNGGLDHKLANSRSRSASHLTKRQMALNVGLKSVPTSASSRWHSSTESDVLNGKIILDSPNRSNGNRRGLSGSKMSASVASPRKGSANSKSNLSTTELSRSSTPSVPFYSLHLKQKIFTNAYNENPDTRLIRGYTWNASSQGLRLQRELSHLESSRAMRRDSRNMSHRLDPMYMMSGSKLTLSSRYAVEDKELKKLQEMRSLREDLVSDLRKIRLPHENSNQKYGRIHTKKTKVKKEMKQTDVKEKQRMHSNEEDTNGVASYDKEEREGEVEGEDKQYNESSRFLPNDNSGELSPQPEVEADSHVSGAEQELVEQYDEDYLENLQNQDISSYTE